MASDCVRAMKKERRTFNMTDDRGVANGDERDAVSRRSRLLIRWRPREVEGIKPRFSKSMCRNA